MKILWLSNRILDEQLNNRTGTWLFSLAQALSEVKEIALGNICVGKVDEIQRSDFKNITQWIIPNEKIKSDGLPSKKIVEAITSAVKEFSPDIIQIWGTENYWGLLSARKIINVNTILNIQGLMSSIVPVFYGGLTIWERIHCIGLKELISPSRSLRGLYVNAKNQTKIEREIITAHDTILIQSPWVKAHINSIKPIFRNYEVERSLRNEFISSKKWQNCYDFDLKEPTLYTTSLGLPFKGIHVLIKAVALLKAKYPNLILNIAGHYSQPGIRRSGYEKFIRGLINKHGLANNINWLGPSSATEVVNQLQKASVFINPSFVESYSLALAEAMYIGTPSVISYAGAMPHLAKDEVSALFFSPGDHINCAFQIDRLFSDKTLANNISKKAIEVAHERHDTKKIVSSYIKIYRDVVDQ